MMVCPQPEPLLARVRKPARYIGMEDDGSIESGTTIGGGRARSAGRSGGRGGRRDMIIRIRYSKLARGRFVSQGDGARLSERALRRVGLPVAYTEGFTPRPKLSFGLALPTAAFPDIDALGVRVLRTHQWITHDGERREVLSLPADVSAPDEVSSA